MELLIRFILVCIVITLSDADEEKKILTGTKGGTITLSDGLLERGYLLYGGNVIASVRNRELDILEDIYVNRLQWNQTSGLFTLTDLQRRDSGIYIIYSKEGKGFTASYNLTVYVAVVGAAGWTEYKPLTAKAGEDITLDVGDTQLHHEDDLSWSYGPDNMVFITFCNGTLQRSFPDRFQLDERSGSLTIRSLTVNDTRLYQCAITNERGPTWKFNLTVAAADPTPTPPGAPHDRTHWIIVGVGSVFLCILLLLFSGKLKEPTGKCCSCLPAEV